MIFIYRLCRKCPANLSVIIRCCKEAQTDLYVLQCGSVVNCRMTRIGTKLMVQIRKIQSNFCINVFILSVKLWFKTMIKGSTTHWKTYPALHSTPPLGVQPTLQTVTVEVYSVVTEVVVVVSQYKRNFPCLPSETESSIPDSTWDGWKSTWSITWSERKDLFFLLQASGAPASE